jgi:hypothetical protein
MADNSQLNENVTAGDIISTDELTTLNGGAASPQKVQRVKVGYGVDGDFNDVNDSQPLPVKLDQVSGVDGGTPPVKAMVIAGVTVGGVVQIIETNASGHIHIADGGSSITVDGPLTNAQLVAEGLAKQSTLDTFKNDNFAQMGGLTETAPANDTDSSGLNGRLQRIAQRLTSLISLFPSSLGQKTSANSMAVVMASDQSAVQVSQPDTFVTGEAGRTAVINNILTVVAGAAATDVSGLRSGSVQVNSTGAAGTFIFEQSNDNVNFRPLPVYNSELTTAVPIVAAITATVSQIIYTFPIRSRYIRLRIATTITGGLTAHSRFSQESWSPAIQAVGNSTAANMLVQVSGSLTSAGTVSTVTTVTAAQLAAPVIVADVASAAVATTTTTSAFTPTFGPTYKVSVPVTVVSGTNPTLDIAIEESADSGTNWYKVYDFPRITAIGFYHSPVIPLTGNRVRYVQTISGTTPSFTRAINRLQSSWTDADRIRQLIDRSVSLTTLNATTPSIFVDGTTNAQLVINLGAATTPPTIQLEGSEDNVNFYTIGTALLGVASSTVRTTIPDVAAKFIRGRVSVIGATVTMGYISIKGF